MANPIRVRTSERRDFKRCQQRWWWAWRQGLKPKGPPATALWFGIGMHLALADWYQPGLKRGRDPRETWTEYAQDEVAFIRTEKYAGADFSDDEFVGAEELGLAMLDGYLELYGVDPSWDVIFAEYTFDIPMVSGGRPGHRFRYNGTFDLVYRDLKDEKIKLGEHKTFKQVRLGHLALDEQTTGYQSSANRMLLDHGILKPGQRIDGITYNILRKALPDNRPRNSAGQYLNKDGSVSKQQPSPYFHREFVEHTWHEQQRNLIRLGREVNQMQTLRETRELTITPTIDCPWDCAFFDMCQLHEQGSDWQEYRDAMYRREDPYADHRYNRKSTGS